MAEAKWKEEETWSATNGKRYTVKRWTIGKRFYVREYVNGKGKKIGFQTCQRDLDPDPERFFQDPSGRFFQEFEDAKAWCESLLSCRVILIRQRYGSPIRIKAERAERGSKPWTVCNVETGEEIMVGSFSTMNEAHKAGKKWIQNNQR